MDKPWMPATRTAIEAGSGPASVRESTAPIQRVTGVGLGSGVAVAVGDGVAVGVDVPVGVAVAVEVEVGSGGKYTGPWVAVVVGVPVGVGSRGLNSTRVSTLGFNSTSKDTLSPSGSIKYLPGVRPVNSTVLGPNSLGFWPVLAVLMGWDIVDSRTGWLFSPTTCTSSRANGTPAPGPSLIRWPSQLTASTGVAVGVAAAAIGVGVTVGHGRGVGVRVGSVSVSPVDWAATAGTALSCALTPIIAMRMSTPVKMTRLKPLFLTKADFSSKVGV